MEKGRRRLKSTAFYPYLEYYWLLPARRTLKANLHLSRPLTCQVSYEDTRGRKRDHQHETTDKIVMRYRQIMSIN